MVPENAWLEEYKAVLEPYSIGDEDGRRRHSNEFVPHVSVLLDSAFNRLERISVIARHECSVEEIIARALSQSGTSRARLGARADEMVEELRARAETWSPNVC